ncbi:hypothetical protein Back11_56370 [Paenibacillus baekrokdamisoli]|uniref:Uncharacterized protein n=1 Tax=Paenibacillus baekrokdamisoli TaxID=1712516 RepID=A0A3G9J167_9BACL|nr:DUF1700 domain-containing protein [Paenibacillus baekrokdamisoli]MBB3073200.1 putative membrane protein [Paenibacillus baekrokdamisoli]BBH24292.1 hypothetical protein Back11_56370 [Paenibacillus baekrokdamisoli]
MDKIMNDYLEKIEKYLKPMSASERLDIVKEIKSVMLELQNNGVSSEQIIERLGNPKELAKAYLGEAISKNSTFSWHKFGAVFAFYSYAGVNGMFVLPFISILSIAFMISGVITPIGGIIKFGGYLMGYDIAGITIEIGAYTASSPMQFLAISIVIGVLMFWLGKVLWKLTIKYIHAISQKMKSAARSF